MPSRIRFCFRWSTVCSLLLIVPLLMVSLNAFATDVYCTGSHPPDPFPPGAYTSLSGAMSSGDFTYNIWGNCTESVNVYASPVSFIGHDGAQITSPPGQYAFYFGQNSQVTDLTITAGGSTSSGLILLGSGWLGMTNTTISGPASGSEGIGIHIGGGGVFWLASTSIVRGFETGLFLRDSSTAMIGTGMDRVVFSQNRTAILATGGSSVVVQGTTVIQDSDVYGINVENSHLSMGVDGSAQLLHNNIGLRLLDSTANVNNLVLEGNRSMAIYHAGGAQGTYRNIRVVGNGTADPGGVAIHIQLGSHLDLLDSSVTNNAGGGVLIAGASASKIVNTSITGNTGPGVDVRNLSFLGLNSATITANGGNDLLCLPVSEIETLSPGSNRLGKVAWTCTLTYRPGSKIRY